MSQRPPRRPVRGATGNPWLPLFVVVVIGSVVVPVWMAVSIARAIEGDPLIANPLDVMFGLLSGSVEWPGGWATLCLVGEGVIVAAAAIVIIGWVRRRRFGKTRADRAARNLAAPRDLAPYTPRGVAESAARLRPNGVDGDPRGHGTLIGKTVPHGVVLRGSWEDTEVDIWGPRTGKTTTRAIPTIVDAPGAVIATSNKRDLHDATRGVRERQGRAWVFDPQGIVGEEPGLWFNPLGAVTGPRKAAELVSHFVAATRSADARTDAYFDTEGENLMGYLFLAAARASLPITAAYQWAADSRDRHPLRILADHGDQLIATKVQSLLEAPEKQRDGVFGAALKLLSCLEEPDVLRWVVPPSSPLVPEFDPTALVTSTDALYLQSKEGEASASPLVAAMTNAVLDAAERRARTRPGGRLDPPLVGVLDEAANVCRIRQLPNLYSHYGSRGICLMTILQSWEQGVEAWGRSGMQKLWSAANVRIYGGGEADADFLGKLSQLIGWYDELTYSESRDRVGHNSRTASLRRQRIFDVADLSSLPQGRVIVLASGAPPAMVEPVPWMASARADEIRRSLATYDPGEIASS